MNALVRAAVGRPVSTVMVMIALVLVSTVAAASLGLAALPEVRLPKLVVSTQYPGLPTQDVRTLLTLPLEDALASSRGLKHLESVSREGVSTLTLEFHWGTDLGVAGVEVREALDAARSVLPSDAKKPLVLPDPADEAVAVVAVVPRSGDLAQAKRLATHDLRTRLQRVSGVGAVVAVGGLDEEVRVDADRTKLQARGLTVADLAQTLAAANYDYPAGTLIEAGDELVVKAQGRVADLDGLGGLWLQAGGPGQTSAPFRLSEVGTVGLAAADPVSVFSVSGTPGVGLFVHKQPGADPVKTVDGVRREVAGLARDWGRDLDVSLAWDGTRQVRDGLAALVLDALAGALVAFLVVYFFVRDPATALIIVVSVPVAIVFTLGTLKLLGRTLNLFSLGGLALSIGMMVDHAVVVLENLHRRVGAGPKTPAAVTAATTDLSMSNVGATATAVIVFLPVLFLPGVVGAVFTDLSLAVIGAHLASFLLSITLVPALFLLLPTRHRPPGRVTLKLERGYRKALVAALHRPWVLAAYLGAVVGVGVCLVPALKFEPFPVLDEGAVDAEVSLSPGTTLTAAGAVGRDLEARLGALPGVASVFSRAGGEADDALYHADPDERQERLHTRVLLAPGVRAEAVTDSIRRALDGIGEAEATLPVSPVVRLLGVEQGGPSLLVTGARPSEARSRLADLRSAPGSPPGLRVRPDGSRPELHFTPDRPQLAQAGADLTSVALALGAGLDGVVPTKVTVGGRDVDVRVRLHTADRASLDAVRQFPVRGEGGRLVAAGELGTLSQVETEAALYRYDRADALIVRSDTGGKWAEGRPGVRVPAWEAAGEQAGSFLLTFALILVLLYLFLGAQTGSFVLPLAVMSAIPLSFAGIVAALVAGGVSVNASSLLGVVALFGVVINNSILLYQVYRDRSRAGSSWPGIVVGGSLTRLRPIVMTASITVLSLLPLVLDPRGSAEGGMALALVGGLSVSTVLTLFVVPLLFLPQFRKRGAR